MRAGEGAGGAVGQAVNVTMTYDAPGAFAIGRLTGITRHGQTVAYGYDRFGRTVQDGQLAYTLDENGNGPRSATLEV